MTDWMTDLTRGMLAGSESFETTGSIATAVHDYLISVGFRDFEGAISLDGAALCCWSEKLCCEVTIDVAFHCLDETITTRRLIVQADHYEFEADLVIGGTKPSAPTLRSTTGGRSGERHQPLPIRRTETKTWRLSEDR